MQRKHDEEIPKVRE